MAELHDCFRKMALDSHNHQDLLSSAFLKETVHQWLREDLPSFDYGGFVVGEKEEKALLLCKGLGVVCGVPFFNEVFAQLNCKVEWQVKEGVLVKPIDVVAVVTGKVKDILIGERLALNCVTRASGIATQARSFQEAAHSKGWKGEIAGTRKTTPGFRIVEKYALLVGGVSTHRYDLSSMVMLKDNHIWSCGSIKKAVQKARTACGFSLKIEVECRSVAEAEEAIEAGADIVMLDNFTPMAADVAAQELKQKWPNTIVEVSGGIELCNAQEFMLPHIDVISVGKLTQGYQAIDFSLKLDKEGHDPRNEVVNSY